MLVDSPGNKNGAFEQSYSSLCTTNDNSAYEQANNSLCTTNDNSVYQQANNSLCTNNDNKHNTETTHAYNHLENSEGQYDTLQNVPDNDSSIITEWNNIYHNIDDGCYCSIDESPSTVNNEIEKKLKDNSLNWPR